MTDSKSQTGEELLDVDRELTAQEMAQVHQQGLDAWLALWQDLEVQTRNAYSVASARTLGECITEHLDAADRSKLFLADVFTCPVCNSLLKRRAGL